MNTELIDFIAEVLGKHTVTARGTVKGLAVFTCRCQWSGPAGMAFRRHVASQVMAAALTATSQVHGENLARIRQETAVSASTQLANRMEAMMRLLSDTGDITPMGARQVRMALRDSCDLAPS